jgi:hypothetical protein
MKKFLIPASIFFACIAAVHVLAGPVRTGKCKATNTCIEQCVPVVIALPLTPPIVYGIKVLPNTAVFPDCDGMGTDTCPQSNFQCQTQIFMGDILCKQLQGFPIFGNYPFNSCIPPNSETPVGDE